MNKKPNFIGRVAWNKGLTKETDERVRKYAETKTGRKRPTLQKKYLNEGNPNWKGDKAGYGALHRWVKRRKPKPKFCENCGKRKPFEVANISGKYKRDINDYKWLCRSCHSKEHRGNKKWYEWINKFKNKKNRKKSKKRK